jgi:hypothetical protein
VLEQELAAEQSQDRLRASRSQSDGLEDIFGCARNLLCPHGNAPPVSYVAVMSLHDNRLQKSPFCRMCLSSLRDTAQPSPVVRGKSEVTKWHSVSSR